MVIKGGTDGDDDFDEQQHVFVERVVAVVKVVIIITKSLSLLVLFTNKKESHFQRKRVCFQKREKEKKQRVCFGSGRKMRFAL